MNNCIIQGSINDFKEEVLFNFNDLKALLIVYMQIDNNSENIMKCVIYDDNIDKFLDRYFNSSFNSFAFVGHLRTSNNFKNFNKTFLEVEEIY